MKYRPSLIALICLNAAAPTFAHEEDIASEVDSETGKRLSAPAQT